MWQNKTRPNKTAKVPYAYTFSEDGPLVLVPDPEMVRWVEDAMDSLDQGHSGRRVAAWLVEKTNQKISHQGIINTSKKNSSRAFQSLINCPSATTHLSSNSSHTKPLRLQLQNSIIIY